MRLHHSMRIFIKSVLIICLFWPTLGRAYTCQTFIDPSAEENGNGTITNPYNTWESCGTVTSGYVRINTDSTYCQKCGTVYTGTKLNFQNASGFLIRI